MGDLGAAHTSSQDRPHHDDGDAPARVRRRRRGGATVPADPAAPPDLDTLTAWCADRLARYKQPSRLALVEALPRNPSGKVLKTELRRLHGSV